MADLEVAVDLLADGEPIGPANPLAVGDLPVLAQLQIAVAHLADVLDRLNGTLTVDTGLPSQVDALTDAELRAAPVVVDTGLTIPTPQTDALTRAELDAAPVGVADDYSLVDHAADQTGADAVLTFTLDPGALVWVDVDPSDPDDATAYRARATVDGTTPTATLGWVCRPGPNPIPVPTAGTVKVWAPAGVVVAVQTVARA